MGTRVNKTDAEWRRDLTAEQYRVMREKGTERPGSGRYDGAREPGVYRCAGCAAELFRSDDKFESGTGWPSFHSPASDDSVVTKSERRLFLRRTEVLCASCDAHLGHVFRDGPRPTVQRYCINSVCLELEASESPSR